MTCGNCKHYKPVRNEKTGRVLTSQPGRCAYPVPWPELPFAYRQIPFVPRFPMGSPVWPDDGGICKFWGAKC